MSTGLAARYASAAEARALSDFLDVIAVEVDYAELHRLNADFHVLMTRLADNSLLTSIANPLEGRLRWLYQKNSDWDRLLSEHRAIADAVLSGDEEKARYLAVEHARTSRGKKLELLFTDDV